LVTDLAGNVGVALRELTVTPPADPIPPEPEPETVIAVAPPEPETGISPEAMARVWYIKAVGLVRSGRPKDALVYYWRAVEADERMVNAWADMAILYNEFGAHNTARETLARARELEPNRADLIHIEAETWHFEGMAKLAKANSASVRAEAQTLLARAAELYGRALDAGRREWLLAARAPTYFLLGELCYYVNHDPAGARAYWSRILELHSPTPNIDPPLFPFENERALRERQTSMWVELGTWQTWARGLVMQLDAMERAGIVPVAPEPAGAPWRSGVSASPFASPSLSGGLGGGLSSMLSSSPVYGSPPGVPAATGTGTGTGAAFYSGAVRPGVPDAVRLPARDWRRGGDTRNPNFSGDFSRDPVANPGGAGQSAPWHSPSFGASR